MKKIGVLISYFLVVLFVHAQDNPENSNIFRISRADLAGENLTPGVQQGESDTSYYQRKVYDGEAFRIYLVAIKNRTNTFESFPIEEFILWLDGKAIVEPEGEEPLTIQAGNYFIQPKGFKGKFNFVSGDEPHLELALVSKKRADSATVSPMTKALILDPNILSGSSEKHQGELSQIYPGVELEVNLVRHEQRTFTGTQKERLIHVVSGIIEVQGKTFYPGDFFVIPASFSGQWKSVGFRPFRALEVLVSDY